MTTLVVEDGTGISTANAAVSLAAFKTYCDDRGKDYSSYSDDELNQAIIRASAFLASTAFKWLGHKTFQRDQKMPWPRVEMWDADGWPIDVDEIPVEYEDAACELAFVEAGTPGSFAPSVTQADKVLSETVGPISVTYANKYTAATDSRPTLTLVRDLLAPFLENGSGSVTLLRV